MEPTDAARLADKREYETTLASWAAMGFIAFGFQALQAPSVVWDTGDGCWRISFQINKKVYSLTEAEMDYFIVGVTEMAAFRQGR